MVLEMYISIFLWRRHFCYSNVISSHSLYYSKGHR